MRFSQDHVENYNALIALLMREQKEAMRGRYALFGHSMGGLLVYGMAQSCSGFGLPPPIRIFASACAAPSQRSDETYIAKNDENALIEDMRKQGGTPDEIYQNEEILQLTLDTLGSDYRVCETFSYFPNKPLTIPLHVFAGKEDDISEDKIQAWSLETNADFSVDWFEGGHFFIKSAEEHVLQRLAHRLSSAQLKIAI